MRNPLGQCLYPDITNAMHFCKVFKYIIIMVHLSHMKSILNSFLPLQQALITPTPHLVFFSSIKSTGFSCGLFKYYCIHKTLYNREWRPPQFYTLDTCIQVSICIVIKARFTIVPLNNIQFHRSYGQNMPKLAKNRLIRPLGARRPSCSIRDAKCKALHFM